MPYLFYYEIIESGEKCSAPNLHSFNLEAASLGTSNHSPFEEKRTLENGTRGDIHDSKISSSDSSPSPSASSSPHSTQSPSAPLSMDSSSSPSKLRAHSIVAAMGYYTDENLKAVTADSNSDSITPSHVASQENGDKVDSVERTIVKMSIEENKSDCKRSLSDSDMLKKLYQMNDQAREPKQESETKEDDAKAEEQGSSEATEVHEGKVTLKTFFGESWKEKEERIRKESPYSHLPNWSILTDILPYERLSPVQHTAQQFHLTNNSRIGSSDSEERR